MFILRKVCLSTGGGGGCLSWMGGGGEYLPWMGVPTLESTYLGLEVPTINGAGVGGGDTYPGQVAPQAVHFLRLPAGGLSCSANFFPKTA